MKSLKRFVLLALIIPATANAIENKNDALHGGEAGSSWKIRSRVWWQVGAVPLYFFGYNIIHEGGHSLAAVAAGERIISFDPYPHTILAEEGKTHFVFASVTYTNSMNKNHENWLYAVPSITDLTLFIATDLILSYTDSESWYAPILFMIGMVCPLIDWIVGMNAISAHSDIDLLSANNGWNRIGVLIVGDAVAAVGIWRILHHGRRLFIEEKSALIEKPMVTISPIVGSGLAGVSFVGTF